MKTYKTGTGLQQIKMTVDIDTFGLAATRAIVVEINSTNPAISVGHSENATGDIPRTEIGTAQFLANKRLSVFTMIDLVGDETTRKLESDRLNGKYILDEGVEGHKEFDDPKKTVNQDYSRVVLFIVIDFKS